ncbi:MAG: 4Fe-4S ferredoxin [Archaeoglobales archaeon]|nr:MAG: 4Fe-4S ferredoxin [Archaeoglobales archaeon]
MRVNPDFVEDLREFGANKVTECFNCGNCTAICPLTTLNEERFPRRIIRFIQLGLVEKIKSSLEPWLCYYCGECSSTCPRQADPGETMMAIRRYLITAYDWTGFSRWLYRSKVNEIIAALVLFFLTLGIIYVLHGPIVTTHTELETFAPSHIVHPAGYIFGLILAIILLGNIYRMYRFTMRDVKAPFSLYIKELKSLAVHFLTQIRLRVCGQGSGIKPQWRNHILIMTGYTVAFILVQVDLFTKWSITNTPPPAWHPAKLFWTYSSVAILYGTTVAMVGRIKKNQPYHQYSHSTDWMFLILLWLTTFTGLLVRIFMELDWPIPTYYTFAVHLALVVPLLGLEVPFAKWSHLAYRPFAIYFENVRRRAMEGKA